jgi:flagellar hook-length control protein FliK
MNLDALRIEPVTPVRSRGTPTGAPTPSAQAPFSRVLSQVEREQTAPTGPQEGSAERTQPATREAAAHAPQDPSSEHQTDSEHTAPSSAQDAHREDGSPGRPGQTQTQTQTQASASAPAQTPAQATGKALGLAKAHAAHAAHSDAHGSSSAKADDPSAASIAETATALAPQAEPTSTRVANADDAISAETRAGDPQSAVASMDATATQAPAQHNVSLEAALGQAQADPDQATGEPVATDSEAGALAGALDLTPARKQSQPAERVELSTSANAPQSAVTQGSARDANTAAAVASPPGAGSQPGTAALQETLQRASERATEAPAAPSSAAPFGQTLRALIHGSESPPPAAPPPASYPITVPFGSPRFGAAFGERVSWMVREGLQSAELTLNPPDLGPIRIALSMEKDAASFGFNATHAQTRAAIEQALPRLRELLAEQGLSLGHTSIDAGTGGQREAWSDAHAAAGRAANGRGANLGASQDDEQGVQSTGRGPRPRVAGRIDLFA